MEREFSENMTPPYHGENPRDLNTSYGRSVQTVLRASHDVFFVTTTLDSAAAEKIVNRILAREDIRKSDEDVRDLRRLQVGSAAFTIVNQQLEGEPTAPAAIAALTFKVDLIVPKSVKLPLELAAKSKPKECPVAPVVTILSTK
jgi:hypothetical protein